jgi:integral membrane protein
MLLIRAFRWTAIAEAVSWLILIVATLVKFAADAPAGVKVMGPIHGTLFLAYVLLALLLRSRLRWSGPTLLIVLAESIVPGGGFLAIRRPDLRDDAARDADAAAAA